MKTKSNVCFKGGEGITFILTHRSRLTYGIHLGIKVTPKDGQEFTLGFYPIKRGTGKFWPTEGAIYIPDHQVDKALKTNTATIINEKPFKLSKNAAERLNAYTCNGIPGENIKWNIMFGVDWYDPNEGWEKGGPGTKEDDHKQFVFVKKFVSKKKYKFAFGDAECTNCQGFLAAIFSDDKDVLDKITPFLHEWASPEVAKSAQALRKAKEDEDMYANDTSMLGHFSKSGYPGALLGGRKSHKKSKKRKPKKKHRRKTKRKLKKRHYCKTKRKTKRKYIRKRRIRKR